MVASPSWIALISHFGRYPLCSCRSAWANYVGPCGVAHNCTVNIEATMEEVAKQTIALITHNPAPPILPPGSPRAHNFGVGGVSFQGSVHSGPISTRQRQPKEEEQTVAPEGFV